uniref:Transposase InsQ for insertion sequence element IS609 n=1 Tax=Klebsiella pneumoniae TaxID=573 RepID=A0A8B0STR4_KLEPN|nr:Putative transposase InsQ for insertion sequence element IS609 [Klebsiella pneumoniae]
MIVIEDLKVSNMSKSAKGTAERPGRNIRAKSGLKPFDTGSGLVRNAQTA